MLLFLSTLETHDDFNPFYSSGQHITQHIFTSVHTRVRIKNGHIHVCVYCIWYLYIHTHTSVCVCVLILIQFYQKNEIYEFGDSEPTSSCPNVFSEAIFALLKYKPNCTDTTTGYIGNCAALNIVCVNICQTHTELIHPTNPPHDQTGGFSSMGRGKKGGFIPQTRHKWHFPCSTRRPNVMAEQRSATFIFL